MNPHSSLHQPQSLLTLKLLKSWKGRLIQMTSRIQKIQAIWVAILVKTFLHIHGTYQEKGNSFSSLVLFSQSLGLLFWQPLLRLKMVLLMTSTVSENDTSQSRKRIFLELEALWKSEGLGCLGRFSRDCSMNHRLWFMDHEIFQHFKIDLENLYSCSAGAMFFIGGFSFCISAFKKYSYNDDIGWFSHKCLLANWRLSLFE